MSTSAILRAAVVCATLTSLAACDLRVTNAGPVPDSELDKVTSAEAIVNGAGRTFSLALGYITLTGGVAAREIVATGVFSVDILGVTALQRAGVLDPAREETDDHWRFAHQARWTAEDGVRRLRESLGADFSSSGVAAEGLIYVGYANRLLGENMCNAVIDGGPAAAPELHFQRAQAAFTEAMAIAQAAGNPALTRAAQAGRATVRIWLGDWDGAVADAGTIPLTFQHHAIYSSSEVAQYNRIYWSNSNQPDRGHSVVGTFFEDYYVASGDPRTPWSTNPQFPRGTTGNILWYFQTKYEQTSSPMRLATGREMRLILAESMLRSGNWEGAMTEINGLRASVGVDPWQVANITEAWTALKRERAIELWLESRRLGDLRRWIADGTPGSADDMTGRDTCFPIGITELRSNGNL